MPIGDDTLSSEGLRKDLHALWLRTNEQLDQLRELEPDWDGEGAVVPEPEIFKSVSAWLSKVAMNDLLPPSRITANPDGALLLEWHQEQEYLEVEFSESNQAEWMVRLPDGSYRHGSLEFHKQMRYETISSAETKPVHNLPVDVTMDGSHYKENIEPAFWFNNDPSLTSAEYLYGT